METIKNLFTDKGKCKEPYEYYFNINEDIRYWGQIQEHFNKFPADSDIVALYYADKYADETHGNYSAKALFMRSR